MATIPVGNFGQSSARGPAIANTPRGNPIAEAGQRVSDIAGNIATDIAAEETKRVEGAKRAQAALTLARAQNELHDAHDTISRGVMDGSVPVDKAESEFRKATSKVRENNLAGWQPDQRDVMDAHLTTTTGSLQRNLGGVIIKRQQADTASTIDQFGEQVSREATRVGPAVAADRYASFVDVAGPSAGLNAAQVQKLKQGFREKVHAGFFESAATGALTAGNAEALGDLVTRLRGAEGEALDPKQRDVLTRQVFGWQQQLLAQRDRAANQAAEAGRKQYNAAVDVFNKATDVALGGAYFSPEFIAEMVQTSAGTEMEKPINDLIASQRNVAGFASMGARQREEMMERFRASRATPGVGTDPNGDRLLTAMETMDGKLKAAVKENAWAAAQRAGVIQDAQQINPGDPAGAVAIVQGRMQRIRDVEAWAGQKVSPLQPQEVEQVSKLVRLLPLDQAATMLANIGAAVGDSERVAAVGRQLHDKDGTLGLAMLYASAQTSEGRKTAELVLRGEQALKDKTAAIDPARESGWKATLAKQIRGAYSNRETEDAVINAAYLITAAKYAEGRPDIDLAVRLATGGISERNGQKFPRPYGMTESEFDKRLSSIKPADLSGQAPNGQVFVGRTPVSVDDFVAGLPKAALVHAGQGLYNVRAGSQLVTNAEGKRITLKVGP